MAAFSWILVTSTLCQLSLSQKYIFVDIIMSVDEGEAYCQATYGTTLASIHSLTDNQEAQNLCQPQGGDSRQACLIGLNDRANERYNDQTGWVWSDGTPFDYSNWASGEPNDYTQNGFTGEDCVVMWKADGQMNDVPCDGPPGHASAYIARFLCNYGTFFPTFSPTLPTANPTPQSGSPTKNPTQNPSKNPTKNPSKNPTKNPIVTPNPSQNPSQNPTKNPTKNPTQNPTKNPTIRPTFLPTLSPSDAPTNMRFSSTANVKEGNLNNSTTKASFLPWIDDLMLLLGVLIFVLLLCICCMGCYYFLSGKKHAKEMEDIDSMHEGIELATGAPQQDGNMATTLRVASHSATDDDMGVLVRAKSEKMNVVNAPHSNVQNNNFGSNQNQMMNMHHNGVMSMPNIMNPMNMNMNNVMNNNMNAIAMNPMMNMYGMNMNMNMNMQQNFGIKPDMAQFYMNQMNTGAVGGSGEQPGAGQLQNNANIANNNSDNNNNNTPIGMPNLPPVPDAPNDEEECEYQNQ